MYHILCNILCIQPSDFRLTFCSSGFNADHKVLRTTFCQIKFIYMLSSTTHLSTSLPNSFFYESKQPVHASLPNSSEFSMKPLLIKNFKMNMRQFNCIFSLNDFQLEKGLTNKFVEGLKVDQNSVLSFSVIRHILICRVFLMDFLDVHEIFYTNYFLMNQLTFFINKSMC